MSNRPDSFFTMYGGDFLRDTMHLTTRQSGAYQLLLIHYYAKGGPLPLDDDQVRTITREDVLMWKTDRPLVMAFFTKEADGWHQKRADKELAGMTKRYERAVKGAEAKHDPSKRQARNKQVLIDSLGEVQASDKQVLNRCKPQPQPQENVPTEHSRSGLGAALDLAAAPPNTSKTWEQAWPRWADFKEKLGGHQWSLWFQNCRVNGSETSIVAGSKFERDEILKRFEDRLADHFGEPVTVKVETEAARETERA